MKPKLTTEQRAEIERRLCERESFDSLAKAYGVSRQIVSRLSMAGLWAGRIVLTPAVPD